MLFRFCELVRGSQQLIAQLRKSSLHFAENLSLYFFHTSIRLEQNRECSNKICKSVICRRDNRHRPDFRREPSANQSRGGEGGPEAEHCKATTLQHLGG